MALGRKPIEIVNEGKHQLLVKAEHWERINLNEIAKVQNGFAFSSSNFVKTGGMPLIRIRDIDKTTTVDRYNGEYSDDFIVKKGDLLIGMDGDFKAAIWKGENALLNQRVCRVISDSKNFDQKFLFVCLQPYLNAINEETSSVTVKHLSSKTIEEIPLPFPPLLEQQAIVSKIEELLSALEKGKQQLQTARQQLKMYRQSLLKWAFEGKLTRLNHYPSDLHDEHDLNMAAEPQIGYIKNQGSDNLPEGWKSLKLKDITLEKEGLRRGPFGSAIKKEFFVLDGYKVYEQGNAIKNDPYRGTYFVNETKYQELIKFKVIPLDLIVSCSGVTLGRICEIPTNAKPGIINQALLRIRLKHNLILNQYFVLYFRGAFFQKKIFDQSQGTAMPNLVGIKDFKEIEMLVPPIEQQKSIIQELESRLTICDKIEETISHSLHQAETLWQSILKKAFEGKLV